MTLGSRKLVAKDRTGFGLELSIDLRFQPMSRDEKAKLKPAAADALDSFAHALDWRFYQMANIGFASRRTKQPRLGIDVAICRAI